MPSIIGTLCTGLLVIAPASIAAERHPAVPGGSRINLSALERSPQVEVRRYLTEHGSAFGVPDVTQVGRVIVDRPWPGMRTIVISQQFGGMLTGKGLVLDVDEENGNVLRSYHGFAPIPSGTTTTPSLSKETAVEIAKMAFDRADAQVMAASVGFYSKPQWETIYLAWSVTLKSSRPTFSGVTFHIDAHTGRVLDERETIHTYVTGVGKVFKPDPRTSEDNGTPPYWNDATTIPSGAYKTVDLANVDPKSNGIYRLRGRYVRSEDFNSQRDNVIDRSDSSFFYTRDQSGFGETMCYYYLNLMCAYVRETLGFSEIFSDADFPIKFDAHESSIPDTNAYEWWPPDSSYAIMGFGSLGIDAAEDADVIIHEFGHAFHSSLFFVYNGSHQGESWNVSDDAGRISEGLGDYLAISYSRLLYPNFEPNTSNNWFGIENPTNLQRSYSSGAAYPSWDIGAVHGQGCILWGSTMTEIEDAIKGATGNADTARNRTTKMIFGGVKRAAQLSDSTMPQYASRILEQAANQYSGAHFDEVLTVLTHRGLDTLSVDATFNNAVTIPSGAHLVVRSGTILKLNQNLTIASGGTFELAGTGIDSLANGKTITINGTMTADSHGAFEWADGSTGGIAVASGGTFTVTNVYGSLGVNRNITVNYGGALIFDGSVHMSASNILVAGTFTTGDVDIYIDNNKSLVVYSGGALNVNGLTQFLWTSGSYGGISIYGSMTIAADEDPVFGRTIFVENGATLTAQSGASFSFESGKGIFIDRGTLTATSTCFGERDSGQKWAGIWAHCDAEENGSPTVSLTNCTVQDVSGDGVNVTSNWSSTYKPLLQISGGIFQDNTGDGIQLDGAHADSYIQNATVKTNGGNGIYSNNTNGLEISGCAVESNTGIGIRVYSGSVQISGEEKNNDIGVKIESSSSSSVSGAKIWGNDDGAGDVGLYLYSCSPSVIGNDLHDNGTHNLTAYNAGSFYASYNMLWNAGGTGNSELYLSGSSYPTLFYNSFHTSGYHNGATGPNSTSQYAIGWTSQSGVTDATYCWWGGYSYSDMASILNGVLSLGYPNDYINVVDDDQIQALSSRPRAPLSKLARNDAVSNARLLLRQAVEHAEAGAYTVAIEKCATVVREYPNSPFAKTALTQLYAFMIRDSRSLSEIESYFGNVVTTRSDLRRDANNLLLEGLVLFGKYDRARDGYRALAYDENEPLTLRRSAWLEIARLSARLHDATKFQEAVDKVRSFGQDTPEADILATDLADWTAMANQRIGVSGANSMADSPEIAAQPNPFNPSTTIRYRVDAAGAVRVGIYAVSGQLIRTLVSETREPGTHTVVWDGDDASGRSVASGVYLVRLTTPAQTATHRVTMVR